MGSKDFWEKSGGGEIVWQGVESRPCGPNDLQESSVSFQLGKQQEQGYSFHQPKQSRNGLLPPRCTTSADNTQKQSH
jgi:hypothetical protein